jgi:hypothetical protein
MSAKRMPYMWALKCLPLLAWSLIVLASPPFSATKRTVTPVLQVFWPDDAGNVPEYVSKSLAHSAVPVTLLTWGDALVPSVNIQNESQADPARLRFVAKYQPWGLSEPWERHNTERFFVLRRYMEARGLETIMYVDSDVVIRDPSARDLPKGCDAVLSLQTDKSELMKWKSNDWVAWAGTSVLSKRVLDDFLAFVEAMYDEPHLRLLRHKRDTAPYVCDMTLWYLYAGAASPELAKRWEWPDDLQLPATPQRTLCDGGANGLDHQHGHLRADGARLKTLHYQGGEKGRIGV